MLKLVDVSTGHGNNAFTRLPAFESVTLEEIWPCSTIDASTISCEERTISVSIGEPNFGETSCNVHVDQKGNRR